VINSLQIDLTKCIAYCILIYMKAKGTPTNQRENTVNAQRSKKIQNLRASLDAMIRDREVEAAKFLISLDACETEQQRKNWISSWGFLDRNQIAKIEAQRAMLDYEIAKNAK